MKARLVYLVNGVEIELKKADLEKLDQFTYGAFRSEQDIIDSPLYAEKLKNLPKNGELKVAFSGMDVPVRAVDYFEAFDFNPLGSGSQYMSVLVGDRKIGPTTRSLRENIVRTLCDVDVVDEFYRKFQDRYTAKERFYHVLGMVYENNELVFEGIKRILDDATGHYDGYFVGRMFIDGLSNFETVKNKDEKGRLVSPKVYMKNQP